MDWGNVDAIGYFFVSKKRMNNFLGKIKGKWQIRSKIVPDEQKNTPCFRSDGYNFWWLRSKNGGDKNYDDDQKLLFSFPRAWTMVMVFDIDGVRWQTFPLSLFHANQLWSNMQSQIYSFGVKYSIIFFMINSQNQTTSNISHNIHQFLYQLHI